MTRKAGRETLRRILVGKQLRRALSGSSATTRCRLSLSARVYGNQNHAKYCADQYAAHTLRPGTGGERQASTWSGAASRAALGIWPEIRS